MEDNGWLNMDDPFQRESFTVVFLPHLQEKVDSYVATWNRHRVRPEVAMFLQDTFVSMNAFKGM